MGMDRSFNRFKLDHDQAKEVLLKMLKDGKMLGEDLW